MSEFIGLNKEFYRELQEEIDSLQIAINSGRVASFDEYKRFGRPLVWSGIRVRPTQTTRK